MTMKPDSIALEIPPRTYDAYAGWGHDSDWEEFAKQLPGAVITQLAKANRAVVASHGIAKMLVEDARGKRQMAEDDRIVHDGFSDSQVEVLELALVELGSLAQTCLENIRTTDPERFTLTSG